MHVALVAPLVSAVRDDRPALGGVEVFLLELIRGLLARDIRVSLLAADGSRVEGAAVPSLGVDARQLATASFAADTERTDLPGQAAAFQRVREWCQAHLSELDVIHAHAFDAPAFDALGQLDGVPVVHTLHLPPIQSGVVAAARRAAGAGARLVAVSRTSARAWSAAGVPIVDAIQNGIDVGRVPFRAQSAGYLLFAGRLSPEKGPDLAVEVAHQVGRRLLVVGNTYDQAFFADVLRPLLTGEVTYLGHRPRAEVLELMAGADATLMPVRWDEPFGLVAIEAQAAGSPVLGFDRGALREVVESGVTGVLVAGDDPAALAAALPACLSLDRAACRAWVQDCFSLQAMLQGYLALYAR